MMRWILSLSFLLVAAFQQPAEALNGNPREVVDKSKMGDKVGDPKILVGQPFDETLAQRKKPFIRQLVALNSYLEADKLMKSGDFSAESGDHIEDGTGLLSDRRQRIVNHFEKRDADFPGPRDESLELRVVSRKKMKKERKGQVKHQKRGLPSSDDSDDTEPNEQNEEESQRQEHRARNVINKLVKVNREQENEGIEHQPLMNDDSLHIKEKRDISGDHESLLESSGSRRKRSVNAMEDGKPDALNDGQVERREQKGEIKQHGREARKKRSRDVAKAMSANEMFSEVDDANNLDSKEDDLLGEANANVQKRDVQEMGADELDTRDPKRKKKIKRIRKKIIRKVKIKKKRPKKKHPRDESGIVSLKGEFDEEEDPMKLNSEEELSEKVIQKRDVQEVGENAELDTRDPETKKKLKPGNKMILKNNRQMRRRDTDHVLLGDNSKENLQSNQERPDQSSNDQNDDSEFRDPNVMGDAKKEWEKTKKWGEKTVRKIKNKFQHRKQKPLLEGTEEDHEKIGDRDHRNLKDKLGDVDAKEDIHVVGEDQVQIRDPTEDDLLGAANIQKRDVQETGADELDTRDPKKKKNIKRIRQKLIRKDVSQLEEETEQQSDNSKERLLSNQHQSDQQLSERFKKGGQNDDSEFRDPNLWDEVKKGWNKTKKWGKKTYNKMKGKVKHGTRKPLVEGTDEKYQEIEGNHEKKEDGYRAKQHNENLIKKPSKKLKDKRDEFDVKEDENGYRIAGLRCVNCVKKVKPAGKRMAYPVKYEPQELNEAEMPVIRIKRSPDVWDETKKTWKKVKKWFARSFQKVKEKINGEKTKSAWRKDRDTHVAEKKAKNDAIHKEKNPIKLDVKKGSVRGNGAIAPKDDTKDRQVDQIDGSKGNQLAPIDGSQVDHGAPKDRRKGDEVASIDGSKDDSGVLKDGRRGEQVASIDRNMDDAGVPKDGSKGEQVASIDGSKDDPGVPKDRSKGEQVASIDGKRDDPGVPKDGSKDDIVARKDDIGV